MCGCIALKDTHNFGQLISFNKLNGNLFKMDDSKDRKINHKRILIEILDLIHYNVFTLDINWFSLITRPIIYGWRDLDCLFPGLHATTGKTMPGL